MNYALVTGGSRGIGAAIARRLAAAGLGVIVNYRSNAEAARATADAIAADCAEQGHFLAGRLPFDPVVTRAMVRRQALTEFDNPLGHLLKDMWSALQDFPAGNRQGRK